MRVGVNAVPLRTSGGGARYVFTELLERLLTLDETNEYVIFSHFYGLGVVNQLPQLHNHLRLPATSGRRPHVIEVGCEEDIFNHRHEFDLFFGPLNNLQPRIYDRPSVAILHDIQEQYFPQYFSEPDLRARHEIYPEICRSATILVTISEFCKNSIIEKFGIDPGKIEVVYNAPQRRLVQRPADDDGTWRRDPLPQRFFFYPAVCYPHKNHALLLDALVALREKTGRCPAVVFTGFELPRGYPLRAEITRRGLNDSCRVFDEVDVDELRYLYRHALALVMPTKFEGFGLPAIEALACGCPALLADVPALREVAGEHALYFNPEHREPLVELLQQVEEDAELRRRLGAAGPAVAVRFSWDASAQRMREVFNEAAARFIDRGLTNGHALSPWPRIGVLVTTTKSGYGVPEAIKDIWATGYPKLALTVDLRDEDQEAEDRARVEEFLSQAAVPYQSLPVAETGTAARVQRFAEEEHVDLVVELLAGRSRLLTTALHSIGWGYRRQPDHVAYLGEAWEHIPPGGIRRVARLRWLASGAWKLEGFLYPELLFINWHNLNGWEPGRMAVNAAGADWRWVLVREAHRAARLGVLRRSVAICEPAAITWLERYRSLRLGADAAYDGNGHRQPGSWLRGLKPILRPATRLLPAGLRAKGKRIWDHLANEA
jgi:glycosyltransferase involved in cell wall biosynthesis